MSPAATIDTMRRTRFQHDAFLYADADEFLAGTIPFLREGLEADEPALVAVGRSRLAALKAELGADADAVRFLDMEEVGRNPARIIPLWRRFLDERGAEDRPVRGIGEPVWPGRGAAAIDECQRHEALLNYAFWDGPAWRLLCPYDSAGLDDEVLATAHDTHACVGGTAADPRAAAGEGLDPYACRPFAGALSPRPERALGIAFDRNALHDARELAAAEARRARLSDDRVFDLVAAVGELTANSVMHGGGNGVLCIWREADVLLVEVEDGGTIDEPLIGRVRPQPRQENGRGIWMSNHLCDLVQIRSGAGGTRVRLHMELN